MIDIACILACQACWREDINTSTPECPDRGRQYTTDCGFLSFTPVPSSDIDVLEKWDLREKLQANGLASYEDAPDENLSVGKRRDAQAYASFCRIDDCLILDVGCGPQRLPSYGKKHRRSLIGIDPLPGATKQNYYFIQGIAEYPPFRDRVFDRVLFEISLNHFLNPLRALHEARRVLKTGRQVCI